jgi:hypothetical protein
VHRRYVMVFLDGVRSPTSVLPCHERTWNAGSCCGAATREGVDDVGYINAVVADAIDRFGLDRRRVGAVDHSLRGFALTVYHYLPPSSRVVLSRTLRRWWWLW